MPRDASDEQAERDLLEAIERRDELKEALKYAPPDKLAAGQALLRSFEAKIEKAEDAIAKVQKHVSKHDAALDARRQEILDMLPLLDKLEKEPTTPKAAFKKIKLTREESLRFLRLDAEERGIANDDH